MPKICPLLQTNFSPTILDALFLSIAKPNIFPLPDPKSKIQYSDNLVPANFSNYRAKYFTPPNSTKTNRYLATFHNTN
jgi:hypothetical protein